MKYVKIIGKNNDIYNINKDMIIFVKTDINNLNTQIYYNGGNLDIKHDDYASMIKTAKILGVKL